MQAISRISLGLVALGAVVTAVPAATAGFETTLVNCELDACPHMQACIAPLCLIGDLICNWQGTGLLAGLSPVIVNTRDLAVGVAYNVLAAPGSYTGYSGIAVLCP